MQPSNERNNKSLMSMTESYLKELLKEADGAPLVEGVEGMEAATKLSFGDRVRLIASVTHFLAIKHRISPEEPEDGITEYRNTLSRAPRGGDGDAEAAPSSTSFAADGSAASGPASPASATIVPIGKPRSTQ